MRNLTLDNHQRNHSRCTYPFVFHSLGFGQYCSSSWLFTDNFTVMFWVWHTNNRYCNWLASPPIIRLLKFYNFCKPLKYSIRGLTLESMNLMLDALTQLKLQNRLTMRDQYTVQLVFINPSCLVSNSLINLILVLINVPVLWY
jgi:hypothetical protein